MNRSLHSRGLLTASSLAVLLALGACGERNDGTTVGQKVDQAIANSAETAKNVKEGAQQTAQGVKEGAKEAAADTQSAAQQAGQKAEQVGEKASDATAEAKTSVMGAASTAKEKAATAADRAGAKVDDAQITANVKTGLSADKDLSATQINVDTRDGVVTLKGTAPSDQAKSRANEIARNVKDVKSVNNQLTVKAG